MKLAAFLSPLALAGAMVLYACIPNPQSQVNAGVSLYECVESHWGQSFPTIVIACGPNEETVIADVIADLTLLLSKQSDAGVASFKTPYSAEPLVIAALARKTAAAADAGAP